MTALAVNTDAIVDCKFCSPVIPDTMDTSISTSPPINTSIGCNTDSVEKKEFAALLRQADEIERLEAEVEEKEITSPAFESL